ncbi:hypothetical protein Tcan_15568 [Toxocara canis]|uniref:Uncharacterized protein n=1 Tax=Toxocara canis TaxID=6265 RepID=A0A0B2VSF9_TOXCA|nr:hypothetical protein Tcan_15568 [Toxocara canis]
MDAGDDDDGRVYLVASKPSYVDEEGNDVQPINWPYVESPLRYMKRRVSEREINSLLKGTWLG